jgi:DNA-binding protein HU-beta
MNKKELISALAEATGLTQAAASRAMDAILRAIAEALEKGEMVSLVGFGSFSVRRRAARSGRNPRTGETIKIPAAKVPAFKPGKALREAARKTPDLMAMRPPVVY